MMKFELSAITLERPAAETGTCDLVAVMRSGGAVLQHIDECPKCSAEVDDFFANRTL